jgi:hypothetical protein
MGAKSSYIPQASFLELGTEYELKLSENQVEGSKGENLCMGRFRAIIA